MAAARALALAAARRRLARPPPAAALEAPRAPPLGGRFALVTAYARPRPPPAAALEAPRAPALGGRLAVVRRPPPPPAAAPAPGGRIAPVNLLPPAAALRAPRAPALGGRVAPAAIVRLPPPATAVPPARTPALLGPRGLLGVRLRLPSREALGLHGFCTGAKQGRDDGGGKRVNGQNRVENADGANTKPAKDEVDATKPPGDDIRKPVAEIPHTGKEKVPGDADAGKTTEYEKIKELFEQHRKLQRTGRITQTLLIAFLMACELLVIAALAAIYGVSLAIEQAQEKIKTDVTQEMVNDVLDHVSSYLTKKAFDYVNNRVASAWDAVAFWRRLRKTSKKA